MEIMIHPLFQMAKLVATSNNAKPTYNMVWQSKVGAPAITLSWKVQYALSWTADQPSQGVPIDIWGTWQACNWGESYDINTNGYWTPSATKGPDRWLNVGNVDYSYPGVQGIHIVVGMWNLKTASYDPIFDDKAALPKGSSAQYQPLEQFSWWLEGGDLPGQVFSGTRSVSTHWDLSIPSDPVADKYEYSTSFLMSSPEPKWIISKGSAPDYLMTSRLVSNTVDSDDNSSHDAERRVVAAVPAPTSTPAALSTTDVPGAPQVGQNGSADGQGDQEPSIASKGTTAQNFQTGVAA